MNLWKRAKVLFWLSGLEWDRKKVEERAVVLPLSQEKKMATIVEMNKPDYFPNEEQDEQAP